MQPSPFTLWAKLDQNTWPNGYHPLLCHMLDVGLVAQKLFLQAIGLVEKTIPGNC